MTSGLSFNAIDNKFGLFIPNHQIKTICSYCLQANNIETGGILVGKYNDLHDLALVSEVLPAPLDSRAGPTWFERGTRGLQSHLHKSWKDKREFYIGEWHFHPKASPTRSVQDLCEMSSNKLKRAFQCPEPVLFIVGGFEPVWKFSAYVYPGDGLEVTLSQKHESNFNLGRSKE